VFRNLGRWTVQFNITLLWPRSGCGSAQGDFSAYGRRTLWKHCFKKMDQEGVGHVVIDVLKTMVCERQVVIDSKLRLGGRCSVVVESDIVYFDGLTFCLTSLSILLNVKLHTMLKIFHPIPKNISIPKQTNTSENLQVNHKMGHRRRMNWLINSILPVKMVRNRIEAKPSATNGDFNHQESVYRPYPAPPRPAIRPPVGKG